MVIRFTVLYYEYDCNLTYSIFDSLQLAKAYKILHGSVHSCDMWEGKHADMLFS